MPRAAGSPEELLSTMTNDEIFEKAQNLRMSEASLLDAILHGQHPNPHAAVKDLVRERMERQRQLQLRESHAVLGENISARHAAGKYFICFMFVAFVSSATLLCFLFQYSYRACQGHDTVSTVLDAGIGGSATWVRLGSLLLAGANMLFLRLCGFGGASLGQVMINVRAAGQSARLYKMPPAPSNPASWKAVVGAAGVFKMLCHEDRANPEPQSRWKLARDALNLSPRQAKSAAMAKLILWHLSQPIGYFYVLMAYRCELDAGQMLMGTIVAVREGFYVISVLAAAYLCPVYLLIELPPVRMGAGWSPPMTLEIGGTQQQLCCWKRIDWEGVGCWVAYLLVPHHFVTACLAKRTQKWGDMIGIYFLLVATVEFVGDFVSFVALMVLCDQVTIWRAAGLALGYGLTSVGFAWVTFICCCVGSRHG
jgi:hypothetical protein